LKSYTKLALKPLESYGLTLHSVTAVTDKGCSVSLDMSPGTSSAPTPPSDTAQGNTRTALFLLDRFAVSDEFYHEFAQVPTKSIYVCSPDLVHHLRAHKLNIDFPRDAPPTPHQKAPQLSQQ
jgi:hypothetical protein